VRPRRTCSPEKGALVLRGFSFGVCKMRNVTFYLGPANGLAQRVLQIRQISVAGQDTAPALAVDVTLGAVDNTTQALADGLMWQAVLTDTTATGEVSTPQIINFHTGFLQFPGPESLDDGTFFRILHMEDLSSSSSSSSASSASSSSWSSQSWSSSSSASSSSSSTSSSSHSISSSSLTSSSSATSSESSSSATSSASSSSTSSTSSSSATSSASSSSTSSTSSSSATSSASSSSASSTSSTSSSSWSSQSAEA